MRVIGVTGTRNNYGTHPGYIVEMNEGDINTLCREEARNVVCGTKLHIRDEVLRLRKLDEHRKDFGELAEQLRAFAALLDAQQLTVENVAKATQTEAKE